MPAGVVGRKIAAAAGKPTAEIVLSVGGKFLALLSALWPGGADRIMQVYHDDLLEAIRQARAPGADEGSDSGGAC